MEKPVKTTITGIRRRIPVSAGRMADVTMSASDIDRADLNEYEMKGLINVLKSELHYQMQSGLGALERTWAYKLLRELEPEAEILQRFRACYSAHVEKANRLYGGDLLYYTRPNGQFMTPLSEDDCEALAYTLKPVH